MFSYAGFAGLELGPACSDVDALTDSADEVVPDRGLVGSLFASDCRSAAEAERFLASPGAVFSACSFVATSFCLPGAGFVLGAFSRPVFLPAAVAAGVFGAMFLPFPPPGLVGALGKAALGEVGAAGGAGEGLGGGGAAGAEGGSCGCRGTKGGGAGLSSIPKCAMDPKFSFDLLKRFLLRSRTTGHLFHMCSVESH